MYVSGIWLDAAEPSSRGRHPCAHRLFLPKESIGKQIKQKTTKTAAGYNMLQYGSKGIVSNMAPKESSHKFAVFFFFFFCKRNAFLGVGKAHDRFE